jgi:cytochrome d ubiquinol oxidase subunit I
MPFQFGTNWSRFSDATANVLAPLFAYEGLTAFFLEAAFLGVLLFGRRLVPKPAYFFSALMVAGGTLLSSFWILSVNSWMQTPSGYELIDGRFYPADWSKIVFNPSFPYRLAHTVTAFFLTAALVVAGVGAYLLRRGTFPEESKVIFSMSLWMLTALTPLQFVIGDLHGLNTLKHQPAKVAAMEGLWETERGAPALLFAIPLQDQEKNALEMGVPNLASWYLTHSLDGEVKGLKAFPADERPPVGVVFFAFRIMVGCGLAVLALVCASLWLRWQGRLLDARWFQHAMIAASPLGFIAVLAGWTTTEVGRQPWIVYGLMRTAESVPPSLTASDVMVSLTAYIVVYLLIYPAGLMVMAKMVREGPVGKAALPSVEAGRPEAPVDAAAAARRSE